MRGMLIRRTGCSRHREEGGRGRRLPASPPFDAYVTKLFTLRSRMLELAPRLSRAYSGVGRLGGLM